MMHATNQNRRTWIADVGAVALAAVFLVAAWPKIEEPAAFALAIYRYQILPSGLINLAAVYLPWMELITALLLLAPRFRKGAALLILAMLILFTIAIALSLARGLNIACGCFTTDASAAHSSWFNLLRNGFLLILAGVMAWTAQPREA